MYGADCLRKVAVEESGAGSGFGREASCIICASEIVDDVGTAAAEA